MQIAPLYEPVLSDLEKVRATLVGTASNAPGPAIGDMLDHVLEREGKGVRPALTLLASRACSADRSLAVLMGTAVELLHVATLVHDDTVDRSAVRRGKATVHAVWDDRVAVLLGDYMFATSATCVCDTGNMRVVRRFAETITELSSGELMEHLCARDASVTREQYLKRIYYKTASLFRTAAESGALLGGAPQEEVDALGRYGYNVGMAFQVMDDILDIEGDAAEVGKPVGSDLRQGTLTLPAIMLLERVTEGNPIRELFDGAEPDGSLSRAVEMIRCSSIIDETRQLAAEFCQQALDALAVVPEGEVRRSLEGIARYAGQRRW